MRPHLILCVLYKVCPKLSACSQCLLPEVGLALAPVRRAQPLSMSMRPAQALYFLSSFFGQFGPNATTWLLPGEVFPTDIRATCHGISAATGKVGALVAGIWFAYLTNADKFYVAAFFNLVCSSAWQLPYLHALLACRVHSAAWGASITCGSNSGKPTAAALLMGNV